MYLCNGYISLYNKLIILQYALWTGHVCSALDSQPRPYLYAALQRVSFTFSLPFIRHSSIWDSVLAHWIWKNTQLRSHLQEILTRRHTYAHSVWLTYCPVGTWVLYNTHFLTGMEGWTQAYLSLVSVNPVQAEGEQGILGTDVKPLVALIQQHGLRLKRRSMSLEHPGSV